MAATDRVAPQAVRPIVQRLLGYRRFLEQEFRSGDST
jgi:hypothetical protein